VSDEPNGAARAQVSERLVVELGAAFQQRIVYPATHPQVRRSIERAIAAFYAWCAETGAREASLLVLEGQLLVDRQSVPEGATWTRGLLLAFGRHGLGGMTLSAGLDTDELVRFLDSCSESARPLPSRHLQIGQAGFVGSDPSEPGPATPEGGELPAFAQPDQLAAVKAELAAVAVGGTTRLERLRTMVARLARAAAGARLEPPKLAVADVHDAACLHGLAVALAAMRLGHALGLDGDRLEEVGLAGLLHDVGHLEPAPGEDAAERRRRHTVRGAARLAAVEGLSELAVVAAYEHHLRFDGEPNYPRLALSRRPVAVARLVAVADTWDTVRSRGSATPVEALAVLRDRAGSFLDPTLVELFAAVVETEAS
jgi:hypothetical protein